MSSNEQGPKGVGGVTTSGEKATAYVETVKAKTESEVGTSSGECHTPKYTVSGTVRRDRSGIGGVTIAGGGQATTTSPSGTYSLTFAKDADVTLKFSLVHHNEKTKALGPVTRDMDKVDVELTRKQCTISGTLHFVDGEARDTRVDVEGTKIGLLANKGDQKTRTYKLQVREDTTIKIVAGDVDHFSREPLFKELQVTGDTANVDFTYTRKRVTITGTAKEGTQAVPGVTVKVSRVETPATTTKEGAFEVANLLAGDAYTLTPEHKYFKFDPAEKTVDHLRQDPQIEFKAIRRPFSAKGTVKFADEKTKQVEVELSGPLLATPLTAKTGKSGVYSFAEVPAGGKYAIQPKASAHYDVKGNPIVIDELSRNETGLDFDGTWKEWTISGAVKEQVTSSQVNLARIPLGLSGAATAATQTDGTGNYSFNVAAGGTYVVKPDPLSPYTFNPSQIQVAAIAAAATGKDFVAKWAAPSSGIDRKPLLTTYGLDVKSCPRCTQRPITHAASPLRETQQSYDLCRQLAAIIKGCQKGIKTMVGVLVCAEGNLGAHSGGDDYPDDWQNRAAKAGFTVATMVAPKDLVDRQRRTLTKLTKQDNPIGLCAAPKLIQAANVKGWTPLAMSEICLQLEGYPDGATVSSCGTCQSIVAQMLCNV